MIHYLLKGPILLDSLFYLLAVTFAQVPTAIINKHFINDIQSGKPNENAAVPVPIQDTKKYDEDLTRPSAMEVDTNDITQGMDYLLLVFH